MPRPRSLTSDRLAAAALAVIDRTGLAALSMRAVAAELGVATMSLYRYVDGREQLEGLVVDLVLAGVDLSPPPEATWSRQVGTLLERVRSAVAAHPEVVPLTLTHRNTAPSMLRWSEAVLAVLTSAGFTGAARVVALRGLLAYLIGSIQLEHLGSASRPGSAALVRLPAERYPLLAETARHAVRMRPDEEFRRGLSSMLRGLSATLPP